MLTKLSIISTEIKGQLFDTSEHE